MIRQITPQEFQTKIAANIIEAAGNPAAAAMAWYGGAVLLSGMFLGGMLLAARRAGYGTEGAEYMVKATLGPLALSKPQDTTSQQCLRDG